MHTNLLVLSAGNSRLAIGIFVEGKLELVSRVPVDRRDDWQTQIAAAWEQIAHLGDPQVVGASVNPPVIEPLEHLVAQATSCAIRWVGREIDLPIKVATKSPQQTGVDRILNMAAAYELMGQACVVVDAGTAVTVDCCNDRGDFLGGAIAPGVAMMLDALHQRIARLPRVEFAVPTGAFGESTESSILHGVYFGIHGMVRELVENYATELGQWPPLIATGGNAQVLFEGWELVHAVSPDLLLHGIALAYVDHQIEHE
jgi:type III pantothenate kinase